MISSFALFGALETGFIFALVALGVFISFRVLDFPDLTIDGSFPLGTAVAVTAIISGLHPLTATFLSCIARSVVREGKADKKCSLTKPLTKRASQ